MELASKLFLCNGIIFVDWHLGSTVLSMLLKLVQNALAVKINASTTLFPGQPDVS